MENKRIFNSWNGPPPRLPNREKDNPAKQGRDPYRKKTNLSPDGSPSTRAEYQQGGRRRRGGTNSVRAAWVEGVGSGDKVSCGGGESARHLARNAVAARGNWEGGFWKKKCSAGSRR
jgi:hypothetical protein